MIKKHYSRKILLFFIKLVILIIDNHYFCDIIISIEINTLRRPCSNAKES